MCIRDRYKDGNALFSVTVDEAKGESVIPAVRQIIGGENCMEAVSYTHLDVYKRQVYTH